jgi:hypothetical protein
MSSEDEFSSEVENTPLYLEMVEVLTKCDKDSHAFWKAIIHTDDQGSTLEPLNFLQLALERDYAGSSADKISVRLTITAGEYAKVLYPSRNQLQVTLLRFPLLENSTVEDYERPIESERFSALLIEKGPAMTQLQGAEIKDKFSLDITGGLMEVTLQLYNKFDERARVALVGGVYRTTTVEDIILTTLTKVSKSIKVDEDKTFLGVDLWPVNNTTKLDQVVVTHGMHLFDLPGYLQKVHGVYAAGMGSYIQNRIWYVFPLFDTDRFYETQRTLSIYLLPKKKFPEIERTYRVLGSDVMIICTTTSDFRADSNVSYLKTGNATRFTNADGMVDKFGKAKGNHYTVKRQDNNFEFSTGQTGGDIDYAPVADRKITSNPFVYYTEQTMKKGGILTIGWENSKPNLIDPGMPTRIVYFDKEEMKEAYGVVIGLNHMIAKVGEMSTPKHTAVSKLTIFTNLKVQDQ